MGPCGLDAASRAAVGPNNVQRDVVAPIIRQSVSRLEHLRRD
jgi:hypothetical protein